MNDHVAAEVDEPSNRDQPMSADDHTEETYQPAARRPIADLFRQTAGLAVRLCVRLDIHPDVVSYSSIVAAGLAAVCFWQAGQMLWLLIPAAGFCYVRLWLNMLDGMVALASGKASPRGEIVNELPDRVSDVLIFVGVAHSGLCHPLGGYWAAIFALFTAYVGTLGQAIGAQRQFGGVMSKPWRMVVLHIGSWLLLADRWGPNLSHGWQLTILDGTLAAIILGCIQTIAVRLSRMVLTLQRNAGA
jgi:phosphatidylglycerophosphate synthase